MIQEVSALMEQYWGWLKDRTKLREIDGHVEITTPYLDRHNDRLQIYAARKSGGFLLSDDGYIIQDLQNSGCELKTPKRQDLLTSTLNGFGVRLQSDALVVDATSENFAHKKHNLVQAMLAVSDLFCLASTTVANIFFEDVTDWLALRHIRYIPKVKFTGKSGYDHLFDFAIPASSQAPERLLQTINRPNRDTAQALAFSWIDTRDVRPPNSKIYAMLNDSEHIPTATVIEALKNYGIEPVLWSQREHVQQALAA